LSVRERLLKSRATSRPQLPPVRKHLPFITIVSTIFHGRLKEGSIGNTDAETLSRKAYRLPRVASKTRVNAGCRLLLPPRVCLERTFQTAIPTGAMVSTHRTTISIASPTAWNSRVTGSRLPGSRRVSAAAKMKVNTTSGSNAPSAAALIGFTGTMSRMRCTTEGICSAAALLVAAPARTLSTTSGAMVNEVT
jgi:hypothetical protein